MSTVHKSIDVAVPVTTAYNQWTQFESFPHFMDGVETITQTDDTHNHWVVNVGGVKREFDTQITEQVPDSVIAWKSTGGDTGGHEGRVTFAAQGPDYTRVDIALDWTPDGVIEKVGAAINIDQRQVDTSAEQFKSFIEERGAATGEYRGSVSDGSVN